MTNYAIILAAGKGSRMKTELPKGAYPILKKPMLEYVYESVKDSAVDETIIVVGYKKEIFEEMFKDEGVTFAYQERQLGTGHAVMCALDKIKDNEGSTVVVCGDLPLITSEVINDIIKYHYDINDDVTIVSTVTDYATGCGRIIRNSNGEVTEVIEERDANDAIKAIKEINTGVCVIKNTILKQLFGGIKESDIKNEFYFTDIAKMAKKAELRMHAYKCENNNYFIGVNDLFTLSLVSNKMKMCINKRHMLNGVAIVDPQTVTISTEVQIEPGVTIYPNTFLTGKTYIGAGSEIGPNTEIHESIIGENTIIRHSLVTDSQVKDNTTVGPFAHLRNHTVLGNNMRVGNFVEIKNSQIDDGTKVAHLTYIGDTTCGKAVNFGCGTVTVNYDGKYKHRTVIGNNVFIGCNANLIAPVKVGNNVFIAAGSTVTDDVPDAAFTIARSRQITKEDYKIKRKESENIK